MKFTDQKIRGLKPKGPRLELSDDGYPLALIITAGGTKSFYFRGRQNGKSYRKKIGSYPDISLSFAREQALLMKLQVRKGELKLDAKMKSKRINIQNASPTVNQVFGQYMRDEACVKCKDGGQRKWQRFENDIAPAIGKKKIASVDYDDLSDIVSDKYERGFSQASNTLQADLSRFFNWCLSKGRKKSGLTTNPMQYVVKLGSPNFRSRYLSEQEIKWFFDCLPVAGDFAPAFKCLLYTVQRKSEIMNARWSDVDQDKLKIFNTKNTLDHLVWLHPTIREKYFMAESRTGDIFHVSNVSVTKPLARLRDDMRRKADEAGVEFTNFTLHDLRRTGTTHMASFLDENDNQKINYEIRNRILNHKPKGTQARHYDLHDGYAEKKAAWRLYGDWLDSISNSRM